MRKNDLTVNQKILKRRFINILRKTANQLENDEIDFDDSIIDKVLKSSLELYRSFGDDYNDIITRRDNQKNGYAKNKLTPT